MRTAAPGWRTRARGAQTGLLPVEAAVVDAKDERRENAMRGPAAASETERGLPRRYLSEAGRARGPAARAAPEHVHIWRSFRTPDAHWLARPGHVGPRARPRPPPAPPPTAPPAPPPRAPDPTRETPRGPARGQGWRVPPGGRGQGCGSEWPAPPRDCCAVGEGPAAPRNCLAQGSAAPQAGVCPRGPAPRMRGFAPARPLRAAPRGSAGSVGCQGRRWAGGGAGRGVPAGRPCGALGPVALRSPEES